MSDAPVGWAMPSTTLGTSLAPGEGTVPGEALPPDRGRGTRADCEGGEKDGGEELCAR